MARGKHDAAVLPDPSADPDQWSRDLQKWLSVVSALLDVPPAPDHEARAKGGKEDDCRPARRGRPRGPAN